VVDHDHNRIKSTGGREIHDKIDGQRSEWYSGIRRNRDKGRGHRVGISFHLLTKGASINIFMNIGTKSRPPIVSFNEFFGLEAARMTRGGVIMETTEQIMAIGRGDIGAVLVI
jgi:hypothetical protein